MIAEMTIAAMLALSPMQSVERAAQLPEDQQPFANCVAERESHNNPRAKNRRSSASGTYQFLDSKWRDGLAHMVSKRLKQHGHPDPKSVRKRLAGTPISKWEPRLQDVAFAAVLNAEGKWSGWRHWYLSGSYCNNLVRR